MGKAVALLDYDVFRCPSALNDVVILENHHVRDLSRQTR